MKKDVVKFIRGLIDRSVEIGEDYLDVSVPEAKSLLAIIDDLRAENARLVATGLTKAQQEALRCSHSFSTGVGPSGEYVTLNFRSKAARERFVDCLIEGRQQ